MATMGSDDEESERFKAASLYDESIDVADAEEVGSPAANSRRAPPESFSVIGTPPVSPLKQVGGGGGVLMAAVRGGVTSGRRASAASASLDDSEDDDEDVQPAIHGSYDPSEFDHLAVPADIKELFQHITRYTPQTVELDNKLRPFIPDFIPAVGDIDAFLKVRRPDGVEDGAGLRLLDEPCAGQSEPAVLHLQLRAVAKQASAKDVVVKKVDAAERNAKAIDRWIKDISDLHHSKPPPTVHYTRPMPDVDSLMQEWPSECEQRLKECGLPSSEVDCDLRHYSDLICSIFDIPVYESRVESLHTLFTLYSAVRNSQFFSGNDAMTEMQN